METRRYIGIDLHRNCFTACLRLENGREYLKEWKLEDMPKFTARLRHPDEVAVEVTGTSACPPASIPSGTLFRFPAGDMPKFTARLRHTDEVAVEVTGNTRLFHSHLIGVPQSSREL